MKILQRFLNNYKFYLFIFLICVLLFWKFFVHGLIPLPADTIVGMYHPWRDFYVKDYPNGIPFNNPLITDPVRQQFVWKKLVIDDYKAGQLPIDNPYSFSGCPLLANFQSGVFYIFNFLFFIFNFPFAWGIYIFLQFFLGAIFMFAFLQNILNKNQQIAFIGAIVWILSGFWIAWAEWGNILHTALWLPLVLLSIDKVVTGQSALPAGRRGRCPVTTNKNKYLFVWSLIYLFSLVFSFFAGHLQTFFYLYAFSLFYFFHHLRTTNYVLRTSLLFFLLNSLFLLFTSIQWIPTFQFILQSARNTDVQNILARADWFIPYQHLIQLFIPDFFGNPAKGNYFGVWNYGEYLSHIGVIPIFLALIGIFYSIKKRKNMFFVGVLAMVLLFALKNPISQISYQLQIPFFSTAQPSRLIFLLDFVLVIFFCKGIINYLASSLSFPPRLWRGKLQRASSVIFFVFLILSTLLSFFQKEHQDIILRNSIAPIGIFLVFLIVIEVINFIKVPNSRKTLFLFGIIFLFTFFDQSRVFWKYNTFAKKEYIFPETKIIKFLIDKGKTEFFRIASLNRQIMPPNFAAYYQIRDIGGYDPLYYEKYAQLFSDNKQANFNRILQLDGPNTKIFSELNVKYVLTFDVLPESQYELIMSEGKTKLYRLLNN